MKTLLVILIFSLLSSSSFALQCESLFSAHIQNRHELLNSFKRISNYGVFSYMVVINEKTKTMSLVVFDIVKNGTFENRPSIADHISELKDLGSVDFIYDKESLNQILISQIANDPQSTPQNNILSPFKKLSEEIDENLVTQSIISWLGQRSNNVKVLLVPESQKQTFFNSIVKFPHYQTFTIDKMIENISNLENKTSEIAN